MKAINVIKKLRLKPAIPENWILSSEKFLQQNIPTQLTNSSPPQTLNQLLIRRIPPSKILQQLGETIDSNVQIDKALIRLDKLYENSDSKVEFVYRLLEIVKPGSELNDIIAQKIISLLKYETITYKAKIEIFKKFIEKFNDANVSLSNKTMESLYETYIPFTEENDIISLLNETCDSSVTRGLLIHYFILLKEYDLAISGFESNVKIDLFLCELLGFHLLAQRESEKFLKLLLIMNTERYPYSINQQLIYIWLDRCIESKDTLSINQFIELSGTSDPLILYDHERLSKLSSLTFSSGFTGQYQKLIRYAISKMKYDHCSKKEVNDLKKISKIGVLEILIKKYGVSKILENRLFKATGLLEISKISINDFKPFIDSLAFELKEKTLTLEDAVLLIEKIHGYHVNDHTYRYAATLHPDEHLTRILLAKQSNSNDSIKSLKDAGIIEHTSTHIGKPLKTSKKYLTARVNSNEVFTVIPLNIVLSVISETSNDLALSIKLIRSQMKKRKVKINNETFKILLNMFDKNPQVHPELVKIAYFFGDHVVLQDEQLRHIFKISSKVNSIDELYTFVDFCKNKFSISDEFYSLIEHTFKEKEDNRYSEFDPKTFT